MNDTFRNPVLPGFRPDPSICRAGGDYFIATSTFEWFSDVVLHHSGDLGRALTCACRWIFAGCPIRRGCARLQFSGSPDGRVWQRIGPVLDASKLSDDHGQGLHFTGAMIGLAAQGLDGMRAVADFDSFVELSENFSTT